MSRVLEFRFWGFCQFPVRLWRMLPISIKIQVEVKSRFIKRHSAALVI